MNAHIKTGFKFARRELRSGLRGFWVFLICLTLGVAAIAIVGTLSASVKRGMAEQGQPLLGGDMQFAVVHRQLQADELAYLKSLGTVSRTASMRAIASANDKRTLIEIKAIDDLYPLYGKITLSDAGSLQNRLLKKAEGWGAFAEPALMVQLGIKPGDSINLGETRFIINSLIKNEPDRIADGFVLGPRLLISHAGLAATGLLKPGSLVSFHYRVKIADPKADLEQIKLQANKQFPDAGWQIRTRNNAAPGASRFIDNLSFFLALTGLTALIVGGTGVANAVATFLDRRKPNIATLKCLGAPSATILATYLIEVLLVASLAIITGLIIAAILPILFAPVLSSLLPVPVTATIEYLPLLRAALFGYLVTIAFSLWPLAIARDTPASHLFGYTASNKLQLPAPGFLITIVAALAAIIILAWVSFPKHGITLYYVLALAVVFAVLTGLARLIMFLARHFARPKSAAMRLAVANLYRPGAPTPSIVLSLGLGLTLFVAMALIDRNVSTELQSSLPKNAPSFFFVDVQNSKVKQFESFIKKQPGVSKTAAAPMLRGRVQKLNGIALEKLTIRPDKQWAFRGDRGLTYSDTLPENSTITAGKWWPKDYSGPPLVSFVEDVATAAGLKIGDTVTVNILGRNVTATIASLRKVEWESLRINFVMVFSPNTLKGAPHTFLVTASMSQPREDDLLRAVSTRYPAVTAVRIKDALDAVNTLLGKLLAAIRAASAITIITGILVLGGAMISGLSTRTYDAVVLKTFGASRLQLIRSFIYEYALLGLITAIFATATGSLAAWMIITRILTMPWHFSLTTAAITALAAMLITITAGLATTWRALTAKPARILRTE